MTARKKKPGTEDAPVGQSTSPGLSGWCIADQHAECLYMACTCEECPPEVHHSRMHERNVVTYGQTVALEIVAGDAEPGDDVVDVPAAA